MKPLDCRGQSEDGLSRVTGVDDESLVRPLSPFQIDCEEAASAWGMVSGIIFLFTIGLVAIPFSIVIAIGFGVLVRWRVKRWLLSKDWQYVKKVKNRGLAWKKYSVIGSIVTAAAGFVVGIVAINSNSKVSRRRTTTIIHDDY